MVLESKSISSSMLAVSNRAAGGVKDQKNEFCVSVYSTWLHCFAGGSIAGVIGQLACQLQQLSGRIQAAASRQVSDLTNRVSDLCSPQTTMNTTEYANGHDSLLPNSQVAQCAVQLGSTGPPGRSRLR